MKRIINWFKIFSFILLSFTGIHAVLAQTATLSGKVLDANSNEVLPFSNVFINQTTIGTSADNNGSYVLTNIPAGMNEIIFSFVGYKSYQVKIDFKSGETQQLDIRLLPDELILESVEVKASRDKEWQKQLKKFEKYFLGTSYFASSCKILNPYVLEFKETDVNSKEMFSATASRPLEIENDALGYRVHYYLKSMLASPEGHNIIGEVRFEEIKSDDIKKVKKWNDNRLAAWLGSERHLFRSMVSGNTKEEGFNLYSDKKGFENATHRTGNFASQIDKTLEAFSMKDKVTSDKNTDEYIIQLKQRLEVHYTKAQTPIKVYSDINYPVSWIQVNGGLLRVKSNGVVLNPGAVILSGSMYQSRVADLLPYNYEPGSVQLTSIMTEVSPATKKLQRMEEKVYLHLDKPYYYAGEKIWFKAYMNYRTPMLIDSLSQVLYVELIGPDKKIMQTKTVFIDAGSGEGGFTIPDKCEPGTFIIRAYTSWMMNYSSTGFYTKTIPVLNEFERPVAMELPAEVNESSVQIKLRNETQSYKSRSRIDLDFELRDKTGNPVYAEFSIAITDTRRVVEVPDENTILTSFQFKTDEALLASKEIRYPIEKGITVSGFYKNKKGQQSSANFLVSEESTGKLLPVSIDKNGKFTIEGLFFYDSSSLAFQLPGKKKKFEGQIEFSPREVPGMEMLNYSVPFATTKSQSIQYQKLNEPSLQENKTGKVITEDLLEPVPPLNKQTVPYAYGKPDFTISGEEIVKSSRTSLADALIGRVPGLRVMGGTLQLGAQSNFSGTASTEAMLIVDGAQFTGGSGDSNYNKLRQINPEIVERVDVIKYGGGTIYGTRGGNGIIIVTTKKANELRPVNEKDEFSLYKSVVGFSSPQPFSAPDYSRIPVKESFADYRSTIYWNPFITTDNLGNAHISFYAAGEASRYKMVIEGVTSSGEPLRSVFYVDIIN